VVAQRQAPADRPSPRSLRAATVPELELARQPGPAAPNPAAARRPCSDRYGAVAERPAPVRARVRRRVRLQAQGWMLEQAAAQARLALARYFRAQHLLA